MDTTLVSDGNLNTATAHSWMCSTQMWHIALQATVEISIPHKNSDSDRKQVIANHSTSLDGCKRSFMFCQWISSETDRFQPALMQNSNIGRMILYNWWEVYMLSYRYILQTTILIILIFRPFNSLRPSDAIWRHRSGSTLAQVMACCLTAPSHYLNQCWLIISKV